jgi:general secretion pathway protein G
MKLNMKKAFTLVEMLIVIVIIGILAAALIPRLTGVQSRARDVARVGDAQQIASALATWQLDNGVYIMSGTM